MINSESTREEVLKAVKQDGNQLQYASDELKRDKDIVRAAMENTSSGATTPAFQHAAASLKADREFVIEMLGMTGHNLQYASDELKSDKEVVLAAVRNKIHAFRHAAISLKNDRDFVLQVVTIHGQGLLYANQVFLNDREIALIALKTTGWLINDLSKNLQQDGELILAAVTENGTNIKYIKEDKITDQLALIAVKQNPYALMCLQFPHNQNNDIVLAAVTQAGRTLKDAHNSCRQNRDIVLAAIKNDGLALFDAAEYLRNDRQCLLEAVKHDDKDGNVLHNLKEHQSHSFLKAYKKLDEKIPNLEGKIKVHAQALLDRVEALFISKQLNESDLRRVLNKTSAFISNPKTKTIEDYQIFVQKSVKSPWSGMRLLGKIMMALSIALAGASIAMGVTGVGALPAVAVGVLAVGLFAAGRACARAGVRSEYILIHELTDTNKRSL